MPFGAEGVEPGIALALSGGGFRATLFHCGALCRLDELGVLSRLDRISSVSGGSITAGVLAARWSALQFEGGVAKDLRELVILPLQMLSGGMTPRDSMPEAIQAVMLLAPTTHFVRFAQAILYRGAGLEVVWPDVAAIAALGVVFFLIALARFRGTVARAMA